MTDQFEYKRVWEFEGELVDLTAAGRDGWELVSVEPRVQHPVAEHAIPPRYIFKRRLATKP